MTLAAIDIALRAATIALLLVLAASMVRDFRHTVAGRLAVAFALGSAAHTATSAIGVRRAKAALSSGCKSHPATAPAGSNRSSHGGNEVAEAFD